MPIYEYKCTECELHLEKMQKVSEDPLKICEACGGKLEKQWSLSGFQFKGEGWYVTDYAKKNGSGSDKADNAEKAEKSEKTEKSSTSDSTESAKPASKEKSEGASSEKKDTVSKKD